MNDMLDPSAAADIPAAPTPAGGKIMLVGIGPGSVDHMTQRARAAIAEADVVIGYVTYIKLVADLVAQMGDAYPKLKADEARITAILKTEEERFFETLANGMDILDTALAGDVKMLPGDVAFKLHDTFGFPLDLTQDVCRERGVSVDAAGFDAAMEKQKAAGRAAGKLARREARHAARTADRSVRLAGHRVGDKIGV